MVTWSMEMGYSMNLNGASGYGSTGKPGQPAQLRYYGNRQYYIRGPGPFQPSRRIFPIPQAEFYTDTIRPGPAAGTIQQPPWQAGGHPCHTACPAADPGKGRPMACLHQQRNDHGDGEVL